MDLRYFATLFIYVFGIIAANLLLTYYGADAVHAVGFLIIPLDLLTRDILHRYWQGKYLWLKMGALTLFGAALTILLNINASSVVVASVLAYVAAMLINTSMYSYLSKYRLFKRMILSSIPAAIADSLIFIFIIFGPALELASIQIAVKCTGVILWSYLYVQFKHKI